MSIRLSNRPVKAGDLAKVAEPFTLKYSKPKVLLVDLQDDSFKALSEKGFNVRSGTFGKPYKIAKDAAFQPMIGAFELPNHSEQEVVVIDLGIHGFAPGPQGEKHTPYPEIDLWAKCNLGFIDPRVRAAYGVREAFDRILEAGGAFIVFADARTGIEVQTARSNARNLYDQNIFPYDVWNFLSELDDLSVDADDGKEMQMCNFETSLARLTAEYLPESHFTCTLQTAYRHEDDWEPLVVNKFEAIVSTCRCRGSKGTVIILPQLANKAGFLAKLFGTVLPELAPHLFPDFEGARWIHRPEYELERVLELAEKQAEVRRQAEKQIRSLETAIEKERAEASWLHDLLTGTDAVLVEATKKALCVLGFTKVVDIDEERDRDGKSRREDLQIQDQSPTLVVDIKGIGAFPSDEDVLQADKHAAIRMREEKRTDIVGLSVINHQRHLPGLERENKMPFRQELLDAAGERTLGLLTAWDLYRIVRNFTKLSWRTEDVIPLFYMKGRIDAVPRHYQFIGTIAKAWTDKFGVVITEGELSVGDRVAVEFPIEFEETDVASMKVNDKEVQQAAIGDPTGLLWPAQKPKLREGMRVFRVQRV